MRKKNSGKKTGSCSSFGGDNGSCHDSSHDSVCFIGKGGGTGHENRKITGADADSLRVKRGWTQKRGDSGRTGCRA